MVENGVFAMISIFYRVCTLMIGAIVEAWARMASVHADPVQRPAIAGRAANQGESDVL